MENNQLFQDFKQLSPEEKIGKVIALAQQIKDENIDSENLVTYLAMYPLSWDMNIIDQTYENIINLMTISVNDHDSSIQKLSQLAQDQLNSIAQRSSQQHNVDDSQAEKLLSNI